MKKLLFLSISLLVLGGCTTMATGPAALATLTPTSAASTASGTVEFREMADGAVEVRVRLTGVPEGVHGFHVHENGSCADGGNAAGGHFNPGGAPHGAPSDPAHHAGDFGNVTADPQGVVNATFTTRSITVEPGPRSVVDRAIILHANPDDLQTQPTGNAGGRIACGVVQRQ